MKHKRPKPPKNLLKEITQEESQSIEERMRKLSDIDINEVEGSNVIEFKPRLAVDGSEPPTGMWLRDLDIGTLFWCRPKSSPGVGLAEYGLINKIGKCALLLENQPSQSVVVPVDGNRFSNQMELVEIVSKNDPRILEIWAQYTDRTTKPTSEP